jgi:signal transduction histidine kinase
LAPLPALAQPPRNVIFLDSGSAGRPLAAELSVAFRDRLTQGAADPPAIFFEWLDVDRFPDPAYAAELERFLGEKFRGQPPMVIAAFTDVATRFALALRARNWPEVPIVFGIASQATADAARAAGQATGVLGRIDVAGTLEAALALLPGTREVVLVAGSDSTLPIAEAALQAFGERIRVRRLVDLPLDETRARLSALPSDSLILYTQIARDGAGRRYFGRQALELLAPAANRPIFSNSGTYLGHGIVGGSLLDVGDFGREMAELVLRVLDGTPASAIPVAESRAVRLLFDERQLRRWEIHERRLPAGSEVRFRAPSLLRDYRGTIGALAAALAIQAGLIAALLLQMRRRRAVESQLHELSGRVISGQEEERRRVARELHDGASQQLALLAIELDQLGLGAPDPRALPERGRALAGRVRELSSDLHRLAYELHPTILDQLGLVAALRQFAARFGAVHGIRVEVGEAGWPPDVPRGISLALYRVAQETLQNVAKHSGATGASLVLRGAADAVRLIVSDDGKGFDLARAGQGAGLGLAGMHERLRLVGGKLHVDSAAGGGTVVTATVPRRALESAVAADPGTGA